MRRLLLLLLCALSGASWGFKPTPGIPYVIVTPSEKAIPGVDSRTIDCVLTGPDAVVLTTKYVAAFDCTNEPVAVYFEPKPGSSTSWYISMAPTYSPQEICYLRKLTVDGVPKNQFQWVCGGTSADGSVFTAKDKSGSDPTQVALKAGNCGLHGSDAVYLSTGWSTLFYATGDCNKPTSHALTVLTQAQYDARLADTAYADSFGSDGCSAGTSDRWSLEFRPSCTKHDNCYTNPWGAKDICDTAFLNDMKEYCKATYSYAQYTTRQTCLLNADLYYAGVDIGGQGAYDGDQEMVRNSIINGHRLIRYHTDY